MTTGKARFSWSLLSSLFPRALWQRRRQRGPAWRLTKASRLSLPGLLILEFALNTFIEWVNRASAINLQKKCRKIWLLVRQQLVQWRYSGRRVGTKWGNQSKYIIQMGYTWYYSLNYSLRVLVSHVVDPWQIQRKGGSGHGDWAWEIWNRPSHSSQARRARSGAENAR